MAKNLIEKYVEEIYTQGLRPQLIEEGAIACQNMAEIVETNKDRIDNNA